MSNIRRIRQKLATLRARRGEIAKAMAYCSEERFHQLARESDGLNRDIAEAENAFDAAYDAATPPEARLFEAQVRGVGAYMAEHRQQEAQRQAAYERAVARNCPQA